MTVYIVQEHLKLDPNKRVLVPKFDLSPAEKFGEFRFCLSPNVSPFNTRVVLEELRENLQHITPDDYLLPVGNPVLIGLTTLVVGEFVNTINFLQWSGAKGGYVPIRADLDV